MLMRSRNMCIHSNPKSYTEKNRLNETDLKVSTSETPAIRKCVPCWQPQERRGRRSIGRKPSSFRLVYIVSPSPVPIKYVDVPDQGVDLGGLDIVKLLDGILDVSLVGL